MTNHQRNPLEKAVTISGMAGHVHRNAQTLQNGSGRNTRWPN